MMVGFLMPMLVGEGRHLGTLLMCLLLEQSWQLMMTMTMTMRRLSGPRDMSNMTTVP